jgi:hypothetical protein
MIQCTDCLSLALLQINAIYAAHFAPYTPARSCVEVAKLPLGVLVEIECSKSTHPNHPPNPASQRRWTCPGLRQCRSPLPRPPPCEAGLTLFSAWSVQLRP